MADRFFTVEPLAPGEHVLSGAEAHHLVAVRRFAPGDRIVLFNGDGNEYPAAIVSTDRKQAVLTVLSVEAVSRELPFPLEIGAAMPKGDRGDFLVEKLVELGAARFTPLVTERTVVLPKESRLDKLRQAVIEASKQCGRNRLMRIGAVTNWADFTKARTSAPCFVLHPAPDSFAATRDPRSGAIAFAIGPEGGFTPAELEVAEAAGWQRMSLGPRVLRVETAAIAAAACASAQ
jgi:16S rRNA (uracil1498-N3)-methyltransferase